MTIFIKRNQVQRRFEMKNIVIYSVFSLLLVSLVSAQKQEVQEVQFNKISDRLFEIVGGRGARGGAYIGDTGILLIDAKMDELSVKQVIEKIKQISDKPIMYLVNTHSDGDHVLGNQFFPATVTMIAHENCRSEFFHPKPDGSPSNWNRLELAPFVPSLTFRQKMDVHLGAVKVELWYFGIGHTTGDIVVYFPQEKTAFLGDQIFLTRPQLIHAYKGGNSFEHVKTLTKMLDTLDAETFCSGHDDPVNRESVQKHIDQIKEMQKKVKSLIAAGNQLQDIKKEFNENEGPLIETIYNEITQGKE